MDVVNRVRKVSRKYAEIKGRPDHYNRLREKERQTQKEQLRIMRRNSAKHKVASKNQGKTFHEAVPGQPKQKRRWRDRIFRRQGR
jgi:hypothetical protein